MEEDKGYGKEREDSRMELRSPAVQEIFGRPPRWIVRWGISVLGLVVALFFVGSALVKYPDRVVSTITVTTWNLPAHVTARVTGRIDSLFVEEGAAVEAGEVLMSIGNPARYEDVERARRCADAYGAFCRGESDVFPAAACPAGLELGGLHPAYQAFAKAADDYRLFEENAYYERKIESLEEQAAIHREISLSARAQMRIAEAQLAVQERLFSTDSMLYVKKAISLVEYEASRSGVLQLRQSRESLRASAANARLSAAQMEQSIWETRQEERERRQSLSMALSGAYGEWQSQLESWRQEYLCIAPMAGKVALSGYWQANQQVVSGDVLLSVVPEEAARMSGRVKLPPQGAGKVKEGQEVHVKFDAYPYMEYGMVKGRVAGISAVPVKAEDGMFLMVEISLSDSLVTNYGNHLPFSQEMPGTAEIVTDDLSILDRILNPIKSALKR